MHLLKDILKTTIFRYYSFVVVVVVVVAKTLFLRFSMFSILYSISGTFSEFSVSRKICHSKVMNYKHQTLFFNFAQNRVNGY